MTGKTSVFHHIMLLQSLRMTLRDWRAGELRFLLIALIVAVAALSSVGFFVDRMRSGLERDARQLLGADLLIRSDKPLSDEWGARARQLGLATSETVVFVSMAAAGEGSAVNAKLVSVKAVASGYPLRGKVKVAEDPDADGVMTDRIPEPGTAWIDASLIHSLGITIGGRIKLGESTFTVAKLITVEPDRGAAFLSVAPRVMLPLSDLAATGLVQPSSRVTYRLLLAGEDTAIASYRKWAQSMVDGGDNRGMRLETIDASRPEMRETLDRGELFLSLVSLLSAMLAAVAVAMAARRFMLRHIDACAMLRCLGLTQNQVMSLYLIEFLVIGLVGSAIGALAGFCAHFVLLDGLGRLVFREMPPPTLMPALQAMAMGLLLLIGFALPPVLQLRGVPHNRVLRRERQAPRPLVLLTYGSGLGAFIAMLLWQAGDRKLGWMTAAGFVGSLAVFAFLAWFGLRLVQRFRNLVRNPDWLFALASLQRRPGATVVQALALSMGLMALLLLIVTRAELMEGWRKATPPDAPNRFVVNIQPEQKNEVEARLRGAGIGDVELYPMIRGRLVQVNGQAIAGDTYVDERAKRLVEREFNLSTMRTLQPHNAIVAGRWYDDSTPEASVEEGLAKTLGLKLGDRMAFNVAGQTVEAAVTSLRRLDWGSMRVNFFVIINPKALHDMPHSWITAYHLPSTKAALDNALTREFPNLTVIDMGHIIRQAQDVLNQVVRGVEYLFLFTLAAGLLVLYAALLGSQDERIREASLLRALGATRRELRRAQWIELTLIGSLAGLLSASGAAMVGWALAIFVFRFPWDFSPLVWVAGLLAGAMCALVGGWMGLRNVLNQPPIQTLREA